MKRIIVISEDLVEPWDEGIKKFAYSVGSALGGGNDVLMLNVDRSGAEPDSASAAAARRLPGSRTFLSGALRDAVRGFAPDAIVYVPSPSDTLASFLRSFWLRRHMPGVAIAMVALIPRRHPGALQFVIQATAPDVVLVPSSRSRAHLEGLSVRADLVPVGVDLAQFRPPRDGERAALRAKYGVDPGAYVYLHVGHLSRKRNLTRLRGLAGDAAVIVVGSTSTEADRRLRDELEAAGVRVIREFVAVEEYYRLADCYVFPVEDEEGCVEIPLSVLESLASGTPVLTTRFGGLADFLDPGDDVRYCDSDEAFLRAAAALRAKGPVTVRDMGRFAWPRVAAEITAALDRARSEGR